MKIRYSSVLLIVWQFCTFALADMSTAGNMLAAALNMPTNVTGGGSYHWTPPHEFQVSNALIRVSRLLQDGDMFVFCLSSSSNVTFATCTVGETFSKREARYRLCDHLVSGVTMPLTDYVSNFRGEVGSNDCFRIVQRVGGSGDLGEDASRHSVAYGNLYVDVQLRTNVTAFTARNLANALIAIGISTATTNK